MSTLRITKEFRFEGAHALTGYNGKCRHIHGHSYRLYITVKGIPISDTTNPKNGMVLDFSDLKKVVNDNIVEIFDHALILKKGAVLSSEISEAYENVVVVDFQPTCENLVIYIQGILKDRLPGKVALQSIRLYETPTSYVEWIADDNR
ncbi:MAG: 6-carboxytetrahydropterin synthase [Bacteroidales bacterium]|nr:6-carboxytetrahydropterin synthase [Bacteroidales bacterium]